MKVKYLIMSCITINIAVCKCGNFPEKNYPIEIINKSEETIYSYLALGGEGGNAYPDTTLSFDKKKIGYTTKPGKASHRALPLLTIEEWISRLPKDTLSIYIFSKDTLDRYNWSEIQLGYKILIRYDLSIEDVNLLHNKYDIPEIPYPPDERMKNMKMYPPFKN
jgi:hypothetical protein